MGVDKVQWAPVLSSIALRAMGIPFLSPSSFRPFKVLIRLWFFHDGFVASETNLIIRISALADNLYISYNVADKNFSVYFTIFQTMLHAKLF